MSTQIKRLYQSGTEFVPITLAEAVVVNGKNIWTSEEVITTLDNVLRTLFGNDSRLNQLVADINKEIIKKDQLVGGQGVEIVIGEDGKVTINSNQTLYKIVQSLPNPSADCVNYIYLVQSSDVGGNIFTEYICTEYEGNYGWETLGNIQTQVDLTGYVTDVELAQQLDGMVKAVDVTTSDNHARVVVGYNIPADLYDSLVEINDDNTIVTG